MIRNEIEEMLVKALKKDTSIIDDLYQINKIVVEELDDLEPFESRGATTDGESDYYQWLEELHDALLYVILGFDKLNRIKKEFLKND